jgi:GalNAc-alpha-(1->4)-GalNAc-alpha-(1->3)-diNAcBac-PP-undecaprenol alpha-1,4-N-acetyl-D-galactosaminyltransferase
MDKKKICLLIQSLQTGGSERVMSELAGYFCEKTNFEVHMVLFGITPEIFYEVPANLKIYKPETVFNNKLRFIYTINRLLYLRQTVRKINPDTLLSFGELWNSFVLMALWGLHYPVYISDRCSPARKFKPVNTLLRRILYPKAKGVIAQTERAKELYASQFRHQNISVIGNPIHLVQNKHSEQRENIVLSVGRLIASKHHDKLIEVFSTISIPDWKLLIVGDDSLKQKNYVRLKELIHNLNMDGRVILAGKQSDIESFYIRSKIFAFTSSSEGFPNVIGEAMSAGLPAVAFNCIAGPSEMVDDGKNGFLVPLYDYDQFKTKLELLMNDNDLRSGFGRNAQDSIKRFSIQKIGEQYLSFIMSTY